MSLLERKKAGGFLDGGKPSVLGKAKAGGFLAGKSAPDEREDENAEQHADRVLSEAEAAFKARAQAEQERFELATDSEYWFAVCFQSRRQKEAFLEGLRRKLGLKGDADKYMDGWELAKALGIDIPREEVPYNTSAKLDKRWLAMSR